MQIEKVPIASLVIDPANARKHNQKNLEAIKGSLAKFGQQKVVVVDENNVVIAGNGTVQEAKALGWTEIVVNRTDLRGTDKTAFAIADNRTGELAEWDDDVLGKTLQGLKDEGFALDAIGFGEDDLQQWLKTPEVVPGCDEDEVPEVTDTRCKPGDLWQLGNHRLLCGDSTNVQHVERLMGGEKADMVFTDPPYGISFSNDSLPKKDFAGVRPGLKHNKYKIIEGDFSDFDPSPILELVPCDEVFIWGANNYADKLPKSTWIVWDRKLNESADGNLAGDFDLCWSKQKHKMAMCRIPWFGVFGHSRKDDGEKKVHPTMKPVKLAEWFFDRWGSKAKVIADLFLGSGSTLIACEKTNRRCFGVEIDPHYCSVIIERWEKFTGKTAVLLTGEKQDA